MKGFKPEVVAYGVKIFSTYPTQLGSYAIRTGTSMSAPYVAGTAALILQRSVAGVPFKQRPTAVRRILTQTADPQVWQQHLTSNELSDRVLPPLHCGSGLARADATSEATWGFDVEGITIYPDQYNRPTMFNATNVAFTGHVPQGTIKFRLELAPSISNWVMGHPQNGLATSTINIWDMYSITPSTLNIGPGTSNISVNTPTKYIFNLILGSQSISPNIDTLWIHSGFIVAEHIAASNGRKTVRRIPFQSILGAKYNINPIQKTNNYPKLDKFNGAALLPETAPAIINGKPLSVALRFRLLTPTQQLFALVEDAASNRTLGMVPGSKSFNVDAQDNIKDSDFLLTWNGAIQISNPSNPKQSKIAPVPDGKYRVRLFVLRPGLNATNQLNYDTWLTPIITVSGIVAKAQTQNTAAIVNENAGTINSVVPKIQTMSVFLHNNLN
ncbi:hypothetical protein BDF19DRAFT_431263 [Syncephalis fuscata]|nr:hypothetical protein BDF19DRAFT_431263 [Syncephalis fuscata]